MKELTKAEYVAIGEAAMKWAAHMNGVIEHTNMELVGRAAVASVAPLVRADVLAKPDPAVEAAYRELVNHTGDSRDAVVLRPVAERIVAAVDAARAK